MSDWVIIDNKKHLNHRNDISKMSNKRLLEEQEKINKIIENSEYEMNRNNVNRLNDKFEVEENEDICGRELHKIYEIINNFIKSFI